jgi:hypothetical protein
MKDFEPQNKRVDEPRTTTDTPHPARHRIFEPAQGGASTSRPAPFVSVENHTTSEPAQRQHDGTGCPLSTVETRNTASSTAMGTSFAQTGNVPRGVPAQDTVTNVLDAATELMAPNNAHWHSLEIPTPLCHDGWSQLLVKHNLLVKYPNIPKYIQHGANAGIPRITKTYIPPNCPSINVHLFAFKEIVTREFDKGRYAGPFTRSEVEQRIGPFQTSPLSMVPKAGKPNKFRLIQNLSFPRKNPTVVELMVCSQQ